MLLHCALLQLAIALLSIAAALAIDREMPVSIPCNVRARGAVGDNTTDDTHAFAAVILDKTCSSIVVPAGAYLLKPLPGLRLGSATAWYCQ